MDKPIVLAVREEAGGRIVKRIVRYPTIRERIAAKGIAPDEFFKLLMQAIDKQFGGSDE
jgi:hypothetical protein